MTIKRRLKRFIKDFESIGIFRTKKVETPDRLSIYFMWNDLDLILEIMTDDRVRLDVSLEIMNTNTQATLVYNDIFRLHNFKFGYDSNDEICLIGKDKDGEKDYIRLPL